MNEHAKLIEFFDDVDSQFSDGSEGLAEFGTLIQAVPKLRYLSAVVKPKLPEIEPDEVATEVLGVVADSPHRQTFTAPAVWSSSPKPKNEAFLALQRWEGVVSECRGETFLARLTDLTSGGPNEEVELLLDDIPHEDLPLVEPGAVFYWSIGYRDEATGQRSRVSTLRFRRLPVWSASELEAARERAEDVAEVFAGD